MKEEKLYKKLESKMDEKWGRLVHYRLNTKKNRIEKCYDGDDGWFVEESEQSTGGQNVL